MLVVIQIKYSVLLKFIEGNMLEKYFWLAKDWGGDAFPKVNDMSYEYRGLLPKAILVITMDLG